VGGTVAGGTTVLPPDGAADELGENTGADDELDDDDDEQLATAPRTISATAAVPIPLAERSTQGNTAVPPISWRHMRRSAQYDGLAGTPVGGWL
jgi:hypothetical protein